MNDPKQMAHDERNEYGETAEVARDLGLDPWTGGDEIEGVGQKAGIAGSGTEAGLAPPDE